MRSEERGTDVAVIKTNSEDVKLLARLIRTEAEGEGEQGMLMVGNVGEPDTWYDQQNTGRYKAHCFFASSGEDCPNVY
ncbi:hypothetical protein RE628_12305 [Paenibacillus sp. D2_2]|uniref:hypothetical protein n=1 Tax=Paenibacillus sp. D2_2 TaxID=3073092 RepID=UPI0028159CCF|nr:hypothetical protein [Paenibacillus sp. D2_2]WMT42984.1 hypothetical protein RE628_12305 [Paenibacillus sp. D2_2]